MDIESLLDDMGIDYYSDDKRFMVLCPFHNDTTPSCGIWAESGYFKCFACDEEGSFAEFISEVEGISVWEARRKCRGQDNISDLEDSINQSLDRTEEKLKYFKWSSFCTTYPPVMPDTQVWEYLEERGLNEESIRRFAIRCGGDTGKFRYRAVLPIRTVEGKLLSYVGRAIRKGMMPKMRNSRSPHRTLFGLFELIAKVGEVPLLVVVEGFLDAIYLQQYGIPAVANMGISRMGMEKIRLLRRYAAKIVLSYDGDEAGQKAMHGNGEKQGELYRLSLHAPTFSVHLPDGCDPNDLSEKEVDEIFGKWRSYV